MDELAAVAADPDAPIAKRLAALSAIVDQVAIRGMAPPDQLAEAVDDLALVDAALATGQTHDVCAALHQLGPRPELATTRKRVVRRLVAAGADGLALAGLALAIGDVPVGARLAADDYAKHIVPRLLRLAPDPLVGAWARWLVTRDPVAGAAVAAALRANGADLTALAVHATAVDRAKLAVM